MHIINADGEAKINLANDAGDIELVWKVGMKRADVRKAIQLVRDNRDIYLAEWSRIHG